MTGSDPANIDPANIDSANIERYADLAAEILAEPTRLGTVRMVAVDGPSGAGKTDFAGRLARALTRTGARVELVHTDDLLDGWDDQFTFWARLAAGVIDPLRAGRPGSYPRYDWVAGRFDGEREVHVPDVLNSRKAARTARLPIQPELTLSVVPDRADGVRLARVWPGTGRVADPVRRWMAAEDEHFRADCTAQRAGRLGTARRRWGTIRRASTFGTETGG